MGGIASALMFAVPWIIRMIYVLIERRQQTNQHISETESKLKQDNNLLTVFLFCEGVRLSTHIICLYRNVIKFLRNEFII